MARLSRRRATGIGAKIACATLGSVRVIGGRFLVAEG